MKLMKVKTWHKIMFGILGFGLVVSLGILAFMRAQNYVANIALDGIGDYTSSHGGEMPEDIINDDVLNTTTNEEIEVSIMDMVIPANADLVDEFGWHKDESIGAWTFSPKVTFKSDSDISICASLFGKVENVIFFDENNTYEVILRHDAKLTSVYSHMSAVTVSEGDEVMTGDVIGEALKTQGGYFEFEIFENTDAVNPVEVFKN